MEFYSAIKRNETAQSAETWIDQGIIILSGVSQLEKDKYHMISLVCGILKNDTNEFTYKTKIDSQI